MAFGPEFRDLLAELRRRGVHGPEAARSIVARRFFALPETDEELEDLTLLTTEPGAFPQKLGLVGGLYAEVSMGWQTVSAAVRRLDDGLAEQDLPTRYCARLAGISIVIAQLGRVHDGLVLARLVMAAVLACYGEESEEWVDAAAAYLQCSMFLESVERDPALQGADDIACRILDHARTIGDDRLVARVLSLTAQWLRRAPDTSDEQKTARLEDAVDRLRESADLRSGPDRGRTLGTLAQVLNDLYVRGIGDTNAIVSAAQEAVQLIDRADRPLQWLVARDLVHQFGGGERELIAFTPDELLEIQERQGTVTAQRCLDHQVRLLWEDDQDVEAWAMLDALWTPLDVPLCQQEDLRRRLLSSAAHLADAGACPCHAFNRHSARPIEKRLKRLPVAEELPARLHLAMHKDFFLPSKDWALFEAPHLIESVENPALIEALVFAVADVHVRQIGQDQGDPLLAIRCGLLAATRILELRLRDLAIETLGVVLGVMARWRDAVLALGIPDAARSNQLEAILDGVLHSAAYFDMSLADPGREWLLVAGRALCAPARASAIASPALALAHSVAFKGALTAELIGRPGLGVGDQVPSDDQTLVEIAALDRLERAADAHSDTADDDNQYAPEWHEELRRAAWLHVGEQRSGSSVRQRRLNQQARYDDLLQRQLAEARTPLGLDYRELIGAGAGNALGAETALIDLYLGEDASGTYATFVTVIAPNGPLGYVVEHARPSSSIVGDAGDRDSQLLLDGIAELVASVRYRVREPSGQHDVSREGAAVLAAAAHDVFGRLHEDLQRLRADGCRHLVICPHGPLALLPFSLLPVEGRPLGDDWLVTVVPTVATALGSWHATHDGQGYEPDPGSLGVIASPSGGDPFGLPEEPRLWDQVTELQQRRRPVIVLPRGSATPAAAIALMGNSRFVHIAAHGSAIAEVPAFHCLYLDAQDDDDGRLFAHDLLRSDLRGVELVTLCACESALGRVDPAGNLRGLPTALLTAGVGAVVATLWPVAAEPALRFFAHLHAELDAGADRLTAFRSAQVASRRNFPRFAHWGAFTYIGYWR